MESATSIIKEMTKEYTESDGYITLEFSTHAISSDMINVMASENEKLKNVSILPVRQWRAFFCETCYRHDKENCIHVELV